MGTLEIIACSEVIQKLIPANLTGKKCDKKHIINILCCIIYKLKTGCQWRMLPIGLYFKTDITWENIYYHFRKWEKKQYFDNIHTELLAAQSSKLDLSIVNLDGSQTICKRGKEAISHKTRKMAKTTNSLYLCDNQGIVLAVSQPLAGKHHDLYQITTQFQQLLDGLKKANISTKGLFLNADAGFDSQEFREQLEQEEIIPSIPQNPRNTKSKKTQNDDYQHFDELCYENRFVIERSHAWLDAYKQLLIRFDVLASTWFAFIKIAISVLIIRKIIFPLFKY